MPTEFGSFNFIGTLAAVINGLGIVRWLSWRLHFGCRRATWFTAQPSS